MQKVKIKFWGTRGSIASPGPKTVLYGGNTPCIEIRYGKELIICDAGTGLYPLGLTLARTGKPINATLLFSHYHWDHMFGLPSFTPLFNKKNHFNIIGRKGLKKALNNLFSPPNLPFRFSAFKARTKLKTCQNQTFKLGVIKIKAFDLHHPNGASGYLFEFPNEKKIIYATDNSPSFDSSGLIMTMKGADILITDAQFTIKEFLEKRSFGHATYQYVLDIARKAEIKRVALFHHDPSHSDKKMSAIERAAKKLGKRIGLKTEIFAAREGMTLEL